MGIRIVASRPSGCYGEIGANGANGANGAVDIESRGTHEEGTFHSGGGFYWRSGILYSVGGRYACNGRQLLGHRGRVRKRVERLYALDDQYRLILLVHASTLVHLRRRWPIEPHVWVMGK